MNASEKANPQLDTINEDTFEGQSFTVGVVMPIAPIESYSAEHWLEIKQIIAEAMASSKKYIISVNLVSDAEDIGIIQKRIIQNLYTSDIIICDVSGKNPNVMFELGMRLAFDKPVVIIKDSDTGYSFDTGIIEHLDYPRDLRFQRIVTFKQKLLEKTERTLEISRQNPEASSFLNNFAISKAGTIPQKDAAINDIILDAVSDLQKEVRILRNRFESNRLHESQKFIVGDNHFIQNYDRYFKPNKSALKSIVAYINNAMYENKNSSVSQAIDDLKDDDKFQLEFMNNYKLTSADFEALVNLASNSSSLMNQ